ncbi:AMP-binding protein [Streptomyces lomondensis]|uniref:AMP-dependent synthetase/ligase domain-containing protein n=2 Tax=Streptomyces lomondensis TaxID=68229 RepID=A0ABQ2XS03_9ACTN|nr:AMP-binding protein [Streptomyces lomondensis]GGX29241.1 hypothetical protein GCM10010383_69830 [Streptomyces lomondensis]
MTHAVESVLGIMAILKSGAAYVPLDPAHPPERLAFMDADARCGLASAQSWTADLLDGTGLPVLLCDDAPDEEPGDAPTTRDGTPPAPPAVGPADVAYVLYTSGSTGDPEGVVVEHGGVVNRLLWDQKAFPTRPGGRILHHTSLGFDISVWEILAPLAAGACLVLAPPADLRDPLSLLRLVENESVTAVGLTPSLLRALLDAGLDDQAGRSLRYVFCGGEPLPTELACRTADATGAEVFNFYGPTEATVDATFWRCSPDERTPVTPIGRPIGNCTVQVLDPQGAPAGIGTPGELLVGGPGLARGYTDGVATDRAFIIVTDGGTARRMYRTGDLVAWRDDGGQGCSPGTSRVGVRAMDRIRPPAHHPLSVDRPRQRTPPPEEDVDATGSRPTAADRWTWLVITAHAQLGLTRPIAEDLRQPRPSAPGVQELRPARAWPQPVHPNETILERDQARPQSRGPGPIGRAGQNKAP